MIAPLVSMTRAVRGETRVVMSATMCGTAASMAKAKCHVPRGGVVLTPTKIAACVEFQHQLRVLNVHKITTKLHHHPAIAIRVLGD